MWSPRRLFRVLAFAEVVTWTMLILGMIGEYVLQLGELGVRIGGGAHGFVFLAYCLVVVLVGIDQRWGSQRILLGLLSAVIPYATVPFERSAARRGDLGEQWRLREGAAASAGPAAAGRVDGAIDGAAALVVRRPIPAALLALVAVVVVYVLLLMAGPPTQWFS